MKKLLALLLTAGAISACGTADNGPRSPGDIEIENAGIINTSRIGDSVVILYQQNSTYASELQAAANTACSKSGDVATNPRVIPLGPAGNIPGVDTKVMFFCA